jgi:hypothetical protein
VTSQSFNWTQQQSTAQGHAAGSAASNVQAQSSQIQVVYEPVEQSKTTIEGTTTTTTTTSQPETETRTDT